MSTGRRLVDSDCIGNSTQRSQTWPFHEVVVKKSTKEPRRTAEESREIYSSRRNRIDKIEPWKMRTRIQGGSPWRLESLRKKDRTPRSNVLKTILPSMCH